MTSDPIPSQRELFDIPNEVAYFNTASLAPLMRAARAAGERALARRAGPWDITAADWFADTEQRRASFAALIGAEPDDIALVPATSYGLAIAAHNLTASRGTNIVLIDEDYPSNVYTWRAFAGRTQADIVTVRREGEENWTEAILRSINERTAIVAVPTVHWTDGTRLDLVMIGQAARAVGARLVIDGSQSIGAVPIDLAAVRPDFLVTVGYKWLLGPFGLGYLYVAAEHHDGEPLEQNWIVREGAEDFARLVDYTDRYQAGARRFDVGERSSLELTPVANAALRQLLDWSVDRVAMSLEPVTRRIADEARAMGFGVDDAADRSPHFLGLRLPENLRDRAAAAMRQAGVFAGVRGSAVRVSPHLYVTDEDVDRLVRALRAPG